MAGAKRTDPDLRERVKAEVTAGDKGGDPGEWSARKAQMAVREYKKRGGSYDERGPRQEDTDLHHWTEERWGTKSGGESGETGERYLPKAVRMLLTEDEYRRTTARKRRAREQFVDQPADVRDKVARLRGEGPTRAMIEERARELGVAVDRQDDATLLHAIEEATDDNGRPSNGPALRGRSKADLLEMARRKGVAGRSRMSKDELARALAG